MTKRHLYAASSTRITANLSRLELLSCWPLLFDLLTPKDCSSVLQICQTFQKTEYKQIAMQNVWIRHERVCGLDAQVRCVSKLILSDVKPCTTLVKYINLKHLKIESENEFKCLLFSFPTSLQSLNTLNAKADGMQFSRITNLPSSLCTLELARSIQDTFPTLYNNISNTLPQTVRCLQMTINHTDDLNCLPHGLEKLHLTTTRGFGMRGNLFTLRENTLPNTLQIFKFQALCSCHFSQNSLPSSLTHLCLSADYKPNSKVSMTTPFQFPCNLQRLVFCSSSGYDLIRSPPLIKLNVPTVVLTLSWLTPNDEAMLDFAVFEHVQDLKIVTSHQVTGANTTCQPTTWKIRNLTKLSKLMSLRLCFPNFIDTNHVDNNRQDDGFCQLGVDLQFPTCLKTLSLSCYNRMELRQNQFLELTNLEKLVLQSRDVFQIDPSYVPTTLGNLILFSEHDHPIELHGDWSNHACLTSLTSITAHRSFGMQTFMIFPPNLQKLTLRSVSEDFFSNETVQISTSLKRLTLNTEQIPLARARFDTPRYPCLQIYSFDIAVVNGMRTVQRAFKTHETA